MAWMPAIPEPSKPKGRGKGKSRGPPQQTKRSEATPLWPKSTKSAAQQGQMVILCCVDPEGTQIFWTGYMAEVHGNTAIQIATTDIPDYIRKGDVGQHEL
eukprot:9900905-Heterocapsa_arctica.AAC.1